MGVELTANEPVVDGVSRISGEGKKDVVAAERKEVAQGGLNEGHNEGCGEEANKFLVDESEHLGAVSVDETADNAQGKEECRESCGG